MLGLPAGELAMFAAMIVAGGVATGLLAGLFGVGGGAVIVPVLYEVFRLMNVPEEVRIQLCVGTSLAIIIPTSIRSFRAHRARGNLPVAILRRWALPIVGGIVLGGLVAAAAPPVVFKASFVVVAVILGCKFLFGTEGWKLGDRLPDSRVLMAFYGIIIGLYSALMGVGGGAVSTVILTLYGQPILQAIGLSAGVGVLISLTGALSFMLAGLPQQALMPPLSIGYVSLIGFILMAPVTSLVAPLGARLAHSLEKRKLEIAFGCFLLLVGARFVISLLP
jgi:uncharacterized membrane protein YfcA